MSTPKYPPCPFCGTPDPEVTTNYRDHFDIENARKDVLEVRLVSCTNCLAGALEQAWLQLEGRQSLDVVVDFQDPAHPVFVEIEAGGQSVRVPHELRKDGLTNLKVAPGISAKAWYARGFADGFDNGNSHLAGLSERTMELYWQDIQAKGEV